MGLLSEYASGLALNIFYDFIKSNFAPDLKKKLIAHTMMQSKNGVLNCLFIKKKVTI